MIALHVFKAPHNWLWAKETRAMSQKTWQEQFDELIAQMPVDMEVSCSVGGGWKLKIRKMGVNNDMGFEASNPDPNTEERRYYTVGNIDDDGRHLAYCAPILTQDPDRGINLADLGWKIPDNLPAAIQKSPVQQIVGMHICNSDGTYQTMNFRDRPESYRFSMSNAKDSLGIQVTMDPTGQVFINGQSVGYVHSLMWPDAARIRGWAVLVMPHEPAPGQALWIEHEGLWLAAGVQPATFQQNP